MGGIIPSIEKAVFPNKVFSYTSAGQIIISSSDGDLKKMIDNFRAGFYFNQNSPEDLAKVLLNISEMSNNEIIKLSKNSKEMFERHFMADNIYENFSEYLIKLAKSKYN